MVPGNTKVDLSAVKALMSGTCVWALEIAERLSGSVVETVLPFTFDPDLELVVDSAVLKRFRLR